jgi:hypothetical protein
VLNVLRPHLIQAYHNAAATPLQQELGRLKQALKRELLWVAEPVLSLSKGSPQPTALILVVRSS